MVPSDSNEYLSPHYLQEIPVFYVAQNVIKGCHAATGIIYFEKSSYNKSQRDALFLKFI